ncbi:hypothetical protein F383_24921 [Gossypium arboreum]|uniref:Uncharacterized protein n=1 Tax=Gossypium arboreum TaxID=29729 RepID=A0A0B0P3X2_GOSAR|nr:hypothetical protein F383_24921 [Gossypium arboreum]
MEYNIAICTKITTEFYIDNFMAHHAIQTFKIFLRNEIHMKNTMDMQCVLDNAWQ